MNHFLKKSLQGLNGAGDLEVIDPKSKAGQTISLDGVVDETLLTTPLMQSVETAEVLDEIATNTPVVRTVAGFTFCDVKEMAHLPTLAYAGTFDAEKGKEMVAKLKSEGWEIVEFSTKYERSGIVLVRGDEAIISYHSSESLRNFATDAYATMSEMEWASGYAHTEF